MITKDMIIADVLSSKEDAVKILKGHGFHCIGCPSMAHETLEEACMVHGIDVEKLLKDLNEG